jgi:uncharacterized protein YndB with AHSA1/START domain
MGQFTLSVFINRSQQDVFDFLSDPANLSKWNTSRARMMSGMFLNSPLEKNLPHWFKE